MTVAFALSTDAHCLASLRAEPPTAKMNPRSVPANNLPLLLCGCPRRGCRLSAESISCVWVVAPAK